MGSASDPLTPAINSILWPYLRGHGFSKTTARRFAREKNGVIQQLWVDANGVAGRRRTLIVLCANFVFGSVKGYMDPHGFRMRPRWDTSDPGLAELSMAQIVDALESTELAALDALSNASDMIESLKRFSVKRTWYATYSELYRRWQNGDPELISIASENRRALKL
ncbi:MAG TPA: hypothetical protein VGM97_01620 [Steroidobacteraceae bacterium]